MFSFVLNLAILSVMFSLLSGAAFLFRKTLLKGREGMMYAVWIIILVLSVTPLQIDIPDVTELVLAEFETVDSAPEAYSGDYSELELAEQLHASGQSGTTDVRRPVEQNLVILSLRRLLARIVSGLDTISVVLFVLWISGAVICFAKAMTGYFGAKQLLFTNSSVCEEPRMLEMLEECRRKMGLKRRIRLRMIDIRSLCSPCVCGCFRPTLYIEPGCRDMSDRELACVLTHELNHVRRGDMFYKLVSLLTTSVHWFNPTSRKVLRIVYEDCELACDYSVIKLFGNDISGLYMNTILNFAERFSENNRLLGAQGINGGLFISHPSSVVFLKRRYANMKNFRKNSIIIVFIALFALLCVVSNVLVLSSCSGITPGSIMSSMNFSEPVEEMLRAYYGLGDDDIITPDMVDSITSLKITANEFYANHTLADFVVNGDEGYAEALPTYVLKSRWDAHIEPILDELTAQENETSYVNEKGKTVTSSAAHKFHAFYCLKDPTDPELTNRAAVEMMATYPELKDKGALYIFDPYASDREINAMYQVADKAGLVDVWDVGGKVFDASSFAYFTNLREIEFVGFTPINYDFPSGVKVTVDGKRVTSVYNEAEARKNEYDSAITDPMEYTFAIPTDGSTVTIPKNNSLDAAIREYFVMQNWAYEKYPLTSKHMEQITSIKAETDKELTALLKEAGAISAFDNCRYICYTINGYTLDIIPHYLQEIDYSGLWQSLEGTAPAASALVKKSYTWSEEYACYILNDDVSSEDKFTLFKAFAENALMKVALVGKSEGGAYLTQFMTGSARVGGIPARYLDGTDTFDETDKALFPNLEEWVITIE
ncbi:MAG: M56 family metallopeptidase [Clostridia bacterium]|nr:M56 family metallopeptidase [Clostridia bacterium]